jgi:hypothetical protein
MLYDQAALRAVVGNWALLQTVARQVESGA